MDSTPLVSVLMTAYNREKYIAEAIESVLASTYENFELIIVDDCSTDATLSIANNYSTEDRRVKVFKNDKNLGDYPNRNKAASFAQGKYLKYLDSDDIIYPHGLRVMIDCMETFPNAGYGLSANGSEKRHYPICLSPHETYKEHFFTDKGDHFNRAPGSSIIDYAAFKKVGGFSGKRMIGDYEMWMKLSRYYSLVKMPRDLVWDRTHLGQESQSDYANQYGTLKKEILIKALIHPDCPLSSTEIEKIKTIQKQKRKKQYYLKILHKIKSINATN